MNITEANAVVTLLDRLDTALRPGPVPLAVAREAREAARAAALEAWDAERAWQAGRLAEMLGVPTDLTGVTP